MSDKRIVTPERARIAAERLINSHFKQSNGAITRLPVNQDDDDIVLTDFLEQADAAYRAGYTQEQLDAAVQSERNALLTAVRIVCDGRPGAAMNAVLEDYPELNVIAAAVREARAQAYEHIASVLESSDESNQDANWCRTAAAAARSDGQNATK